MQSKREPRSLSGVLAYLSPILWQSSKKFKWRFLFATFCVLAGVALNILSPILFRQLVDKLVPGGAKSTFYTVFIALFSYGLCWCVSKIITNVGELVIFRVVTQGIRYFASGFFSHLMGLSANFHINRATGAVVEVFFRAQDGIFHIFWGLFFSLIPLAIEICIATAVITYLFGWVIGLIFVSILLTFIVFSYLGLEWLSHEQRKLNAVKMQVGAKVVDSLLNYETVKVFSNTEHEKIMANNMFMRQEDAYVDFYWRVECLHVGQGAVIGLGLIVLTLITGYKVFCGEFTVGDFTMINWYLMQFVTPLSYLGKVLKDLRKGINDTGNAIEILDAAAQIQDSEDAKELVTKNPSLEFRHVSFSYGNERRILEDVSFVVAPGETVALVGMTGSGKSTIARLLYRFYDVETGGILIDGTDLRELTQESLQRAIGIVPQDTVLFNDTLYYNINYGDLSATPPEIAEAVQRAHLQKTVQALPEGLNTMVGERGLKLSGGEKQRVAIARVLLKKPSIYIFDEATSALDSSTEQQIHQNMREISKGCTTLIIAHRLSTVVHADKIIVLEQGKVAELGKHHELLALNGIYARLYSQQELAK